MLKSWIHVSRNKPCPICGHADWCIVTPEGDAAICYRVESPRPSKGGGWLHVLRERPPDRARGPSPKAPGPSSGTNLLFDAARYHARLRESWDRVWLDGLSLSLGVDMDALERLEPAWDARHQAFAFPMRDGSGKIVGIRLRNHEGRKWAVTGSRAGLFYPADLAGDEIVVLEGPTDTAAALTIGLNAVGRPSCNAGADDLRVLVSRLRVKQVCIVADHDEAKRRQNDNAVWRPGSQGAEALAAQLRRRFKIVMPPHKDFREWATLDGLTKTAFDQYANNTKWRLT